jgi:hypothetical protein
MNQVGTIEGTSGVDCPSPCGDEDLNCFVADIRNITITAALVKNSGSYFSPVKKILKRLEMPISLMIS